MENVTRSDRKKKIKLISILLLIFLFTYVAYSIVNTSHGDFAYFYYAFEVVLTRHPILKLYNIPIQHKWFSLHDLHVYPFNQYVYPPQFASFFSWLASFSMPVASKIWSYTSIFAYTFTVFLIEKVANPKRSVFTKAFIYTTCLLNFPFWWDLIIGNANWLIFSLLGISIYFRYVKQYYWISGIPLGLAIVFKVSPIAFLVFILLRKEWRLAIGALCTILITTLETILVIGTAPIKYYIFNFSHFTATSMENGNAPYNSSIIGVLGYWNQIHFTSLPTVTIHNFFIIYEFIMFMIIVATAFIFNRHPNTDYRLDSAVAILTVLLFSPLIEGPHLLIACLSAWLLIGYWWDTRIRNKWKANLRGIMIGRGIGLFIVWLFLSPLNWVLRPIISSEGFYILMLLTSITFSFVANLKETAR